MIKRIAGALLILFFANLSVAQNDSAKKGSFTFSGFADAYYAYSLNDPSSKNIDYAYNHSRHNEFNVNLALLSVKYSSDKLRSNVALQAGTYPQFNYAAEPSMLQHIYDANVGVRLCKSFWLVSHWF
jgi:Putative beta-barrel porin-2, OmpL-like. bbp2